MVLSSHKTFILLFCIGLLAIKADQVCSLRRETMILTQGRQDQLQVQNNRVLQEVSKQDLDTNRKSAPVTNKFDPEQSSKRKVRRGSDPIHNRS